jgi:hypothetical protein
MKSIRNAVVRAISATLLLGGGWAMGADDLPPPLPIEPTGIIESLPAKYPERWFLVHDAAFFGMSDPGCSGQGPVQRGADGQHIAVRTAE